MGASRHLRLGQGCLGGRLARVFIVQDELGGSSLAGDQTASGGSPVRVATNQGSATGGGRRQFLDVRVRVDDQLPSLLGLCAGYERGAWRANDFARYLIHNVVEFVYPHHEWSNVQSDTAIEMAARAARAVYGSANHGNRGEVGELLLFAIMRSFYGSCPVVSKLYFKSAANDTVKGFDAVHFVDGDAGLELWLGEAKLYTDAGTAIRDVIAELQRHVSADYLRQEFAWVNNKMSTENLRYAELTRLLDERTSLDEIFKVLHVPVLLTYDSAAVRDHTAVDPSFEAAITNEIRKHYDVFRQKFTGEIRVHLILVPLGSKQALLNAFDLKLKALQAV
jgi:hypothetical protein